jgi:hypothetical protein
LELLPTAQCYKFESHISELQILERCNSYVHISEPWNCQTFNKMSNLLGMFDILTFGYLTVRTFIVSNFCLFEHLAQSRFSKI